MKKTIATLIVIFHLNLNAQYNKLIDFANDTLHGIQPQDALISDGTFLYGMTQSGGITGRGTVFKIMPNGAGYTKLLDFKNDTMHGYAPVGSFISDGTFLYGMTLKGGLYGNGIVFKIMSNGTNYTKLHDFGSVTYDGTGPWGSLISDGVFLYGMTEQGGLYGQGIIFKIMPNGLGYDTLYSFKSYTDGRNPFGSLLYDGTFLYGMTVQGGINSIGTIFKIMPNGAGYSKIFDFTNTINGTGKNPHGSLITDGTFLYGMTQSGGTSNNGTIFKIMPDGTNFTKLLDFTGTANGSTPNGSLIYDGTFLYGMAPSGGINNKGTVFKISPNGTGFTKLLDFAGTSNGASPFGSLISDGTCLYGMTCIGGIKNKGTLFSFCNLMGIDQITSNTVNSMIYPNPTSDQFFIETNTTEKSYVDLFDVCGKHLFNKIVSEKSNINVSDLNEGIYTLIIETAGLKINKKLVIVR